MYEILHTGIINKVLCYIYQAVDNIFNHENAQVFQLVIPKYILYRTKLICQYIEDDIDEDFKIENLLMLLYINFIKSCITNYDPKSVYKLLNRSYYDTKTIIISDGIDEISVDREPVDLSILEITISNNDYEKGRLILDEIYELYKCYFSFGKLLECLWLDFIDSYKRGENKKAYQFIVKMIRKCVD